MPLTEMFYEFLIQDSKISIFVKFTIFLVAVALLYIFLRAPQKSSKYGNIDNLIEQYKNKVEHRKKNVTDQVPLQGRILLKEFPVRTEIDHKPVGVTPLRKFKLSSLLE